MSSNTVFRVVERRTNGVIQIVSEGAQYAYITAATGNRERLSCEPGSLICAEVASGDVAGKSASVATEIRKLGPSPGTRQHVLAFARALAPLVALEPELENDAFSRSDLRVYWSPADLADAAFANVPPLQRDDPEALISVLRRQARRRLPTFPGMGSAMGPSDALVDLRKLIAPWLGRRLKWIDAISREATQVISERNDQFDEDPEFFAREGWQGDDDLVHETCVRAVREANSHLEKRGAPVRFRAVEGGTLYEREFLLLSEEQAQLAERLMLAKFLAASQVL